MAIKDRYRLWRRVGRLAIVATTAVVVLLLLSVGVGPFAATPSEAAGVPYLDRLELLTDQATPGASGNGSGNGNGWGSHTVRVERTSTDDVFAMYVAAGSDDNHKQWVVKRRSTNDGWSEVWRGVGGIEPAHLVEQPNNQLGVLSWSQGLPLFASAAGPNGQQPFSTGSIPGPWTRTDYPYESAGTNTRGDVFALQSGVDHSGSFAPGSLQGAYRTASDGSWHGMNISTALRYVYTLLLPTDSGGLDIVGSSGVTWRDAGYTQPSSVGFGYVSDRVHYWHSDQPSSSSFQELEVARYAQPSGTNAYVHVFAQDAYRDTQGRTHILYAVQAPSTGQQVVGHHAIVQNGSVIKDVSLDGVYCPETARLIQDTSGRFFVITGCGQALFIYPADTNDGTQLANPVRLDVSAYPLSSWFWLAVPRGGTARADYVDGVYAAGGDNQLVYFRARLNYSSSVQSAGPYATAVLADSPVGYWRLGETAGKLALDTSGNGNTGAYEGGVALGTSGPASGDGVPAATLDGSTGHVSVPDGPSLEVAAPLTVEAWVKPNAPPHEQRIVSKGSGYGDWNLNLDSSLRPSFALMSGGSYVSAYGSRPVQQGAWTHLVGTFDGYRMVLYVNGVVSRATTWYQWPRLTNWSYTIGQDLAGGTQFNGSVGEVAVYSSALSSDRVTAHYKAGTGGH